MFISGDSHTSVKKGRLKKNISTTPISKFIWIFLVLFDASLRLLLFKSGANAPDLIFVWLDNIYYYTTAYNSVLKIYIILLLSTTTTTTIPIIPIHQCANEKSRHYTTYNKF